MKLINLRNNVKKQKSNWKNKLKSNKRNLI